MTTKIYTQSSLSKEQIEENIKNNSRNEIDWLINEVIRPQLPLVKENLFNCFAKIDEANDQEYKLPLSSHNSEILKGVITRQNFKITGLNISIKSKNVNNGKVFNLRLRNGNVLLIRQILDCHDSIYNSIGIIDKLLDNENIDRSIFLKYIENLCNQIDIAKRSLESPKEAYVFPQYRINSYLLEPELPNSVSLDFFVSNSDLAIDFKSLKPITTKPWDIIVDPRKKISFADYVRSRISEDRSTSISNILISEYNKHLEWKKKEALMAKEEQPVGFGSTIKSIFNSNSDPSCSTLLKSASKYLEEAITYVDNEGNPIVVSIQETCDIVTSDPVLLSISIKLESLEKTIVKILENFKSCI